MESVSIPLTVVALTPFSAVSPVRIAAVRVAPRYLLRTQVVEGNSS